jgi:hypothetical protein
MSEKVVQDETERRRLLKKSSRITFLVRDLVSEQRRLESHHVPFRAPGESSRDVLRLLSFPMVFGEMKRYWHFLAAGHEACQRERDQTRQK